MTTLADIKAAIDELQADCWRQSVTYSADSRAKVDALIAKVVEQRDEAVAGLSKLRDCFRLVTESAIALERLEDAARATTQEPQ